MYIPAAFQVADEPTLFDFIDRHGFATLVSNCAGELFATHLPLLLDRDRRVLLGHVAKNNPQWQCFDGSAEALAIFHGPHAYISPTWYATSPAVPTWNYAAVHVVGAPRLVDRPALEAILDRLLVQYEAPSVPRPNPTPDSFRESLLPGLVGFELPIRQLEGKFKLGQNRPASDQASLLSRLEQGRPEEQALGRLMREWQNAAQ